MQKYRNLEVLIVNGSVQGKKGNAALFLKQHLPKNLNFKIIHLADQKTNKKTFQEILKAKAVLFVTGTYWDSWGSPLQKFFEEFTEFECHPDIIGKPAGCLVMMHSVGGKGILSRMQGVLNTLGFLIPPMSGMVFSLVNQETLRSKNSHAKDLWQAEDLLGIVENLIIATEYSQKTQWKTWPVDKRDPYRIWIK